MSDETGRTPSDEDLAKIARDVQRDYLRAHDGGAWHPDNDDEMWEQIARALRAALCPPVTPLAPGETVTIPTLIPKMFALSFTCDDNRDAILRTSVPMHGEDHALLLDDGGIADLETACRRARAALEGK